MDKEAKKSIDDLRKLEGLCLRIIECNEQISHLFFESRDLHDKYTFYAIDDYKYGTFSMKYLLSTVSRQKQMALSLAGEDQEESFFDVSCVKPDDTHKERHEESNKIKEECYERYRSKQRKISRLMKKRKCFIEQMNDLYDSCRKDKKPAK